MLDQKRPIDRTRAQALVRDAWMSGWWRIAYAPGERAWLLDHWKTCPGTYTEADALRSIAHEPGSPEFDYTDVLF